MVNIQEPIKTKKERQQSPAYGFLGIVVGVGWVFAWIAMEKLFRVDSTPPYDYVVWYIPSYILASGIFSVLMRKVFGSNFFTALMVALILGVLLLWALTSFQSGGLGF